MLRYYFSLILVLLFATQSFAVPSITSTSGTYTHGSTITINTTGAGAKSPAPPYCYDDFENGTNGASIIGQPCAVGSEVWLEYDGRGPTYYSTTDAYNGTVSVKKVSDGNDFVTAGIDGLNSTKAFMSYRWKWSASGTNWEIGTMKQSRITAAGGLYTPDPSLWASSDPGAGWWYEGFNDGVTSSPHYTHTSLQAQNTWHRIVGYMELSTPAGTLNGVVKTWYNETPGRNMTGILTRDSSVPTAVLDSVILPLQLANNSANTFTQYVDDFYFDNTQARVEVCNAAGTLCDIQIPVTWASDGTSITATLNLGSFDPGDTVNVYVFDSTGAKSASHQITIGGSGTDTTPPVITLLAPLGELAYGTTSTDLSQVTDEPSTCRYSTTPGTAYADMIGTFSTSYGLSHSTTITGLTNGTSYTYYTRCIDAFGNANTTDTTYSFSVASAAGTAGVLSWQYGTYEAVRADIRIPINIVRTGGSTGIVTVQWSSNGQTAVHGVDYYGNDNVTVTFADGVTSVPVNTYGAGDDGIEMIQNSAPDDRYFQMVLTNATGGANLGDISLATVTILGESLPPTFPWVNGIFKVGSEFRKAN